jgi:hypothetical protein
VIAEASDTEVERHILEPINIIPNSVEAVHPDDLSPYGLDSPVRLTVTDEEGWSGTLLIGRYDPEREGMYVMIEGIDAVLFHDTAEYSFLRVGYSQLRSSILWLRHINTVYSITYELEDVTRVLRIEHGEGNFLRGWLDGEEILEDNARRLFSATQLLTHDGGTDAEIPQGAEPAYRFTYELTDGETDTMELYSINDTQYLVVRNGENQEVFITRMTLRHILLSRFELLDRGEDLPLRF